MVTSRAKQVRSCIWRNRHRTILAPRDIPPDPSPWPFWILILLLSIDQTLIEQLRRGDRSAFAAVIERHQRAFLRRNREYVRQMQAAFPTLRNMVDARNEVSIRWLRWLGFTIEPAIRWGAAGMPFHPFWMTRDV